jgi:hypothetical protein
MNDYLATTCTGPDVLLVKHRDNFKFIFIIAISISIIIGEINECHQYN